MKQRVVIAGATGFIGYALAKSLSYDGYRVISLSRSAAKSRSILPFAEDHFEFRPGPASPQEWKHSIDGALSVINLVGESIGAGRWTESRKREILASRIVATTELAATIHGTPHPPESFISASAVGYYGNASNSVLDENSPEGLGFLAQVSSQWENSSARAREATRVVNPRIGVVLGLTGGALPRMMAPYKYFLGGSIGSGNQWISWIHINDLVNLFKLIINDSSISGPVNAVAPNPVRMRDFAKELGRAMHKPSFFRVPGWVLKLALGESSSLVLGGQCVWPRVATDKKFQFSFPYLADALPEILKKSEMIL